MKRSFQNRTFQDSAQNKINDDVPVFAGRTFESWMKSVRNDRQLKYKFDALEAAAELARDDSTRQQQVMSEIVKLLRIHGSGSTYRLKQGGNISAPYKKFGNEQRPLFIDILRCFPDEQLMKLLVGEISDGTVRSRQFVTSWLLYPSAVREGDWPATQEYAEVLATQALAIGQATLNAAASPECDEANSQTLSKVIPELTVSLQIDYEKTTSRTLGDVEPAWLEFVEKTFESDMPLKRGFAAVAMTEVAPDRPDLAKDLTQLLADEAVLPLIRCKALQALEKLPAAQVRTVGGSLLKIAQQQGESKEQLEKAATAIGDNDRFNPLREVQIVSGVDYRLAFLLAEAAPETAGLLEWLESVQAKFPSPLMGDNPTQVLEANIILNAIQLVTRHLNESQEAENPVTPAAKSGEKDESESTQ